MQDPNDNADNPDYPPSKAGANAIGQKGAGASSDRVIVPNNQRCGSIDLAAKVNGSDCEKGSPAQMDCCKQSVCASFAESASSDDGQQTTDCTWIQRPVDSSKANLPGYTFLPGACDSTDGDLSDQSSRHQIPFIYSRWDTRGSAMHPFTDEDNGVSLGPKYISICRDQCDTIGQRCVGFTVDKKHTACFLIGSNLTMDDRPQRVPLPRRAP